MQNPLMITPNHRDWQRILAEAITSPLELLNLLNLDHCLLPAANKASKLFGLKVPLPYLQRIERGNPHDPLLRQILPLGTELLAQPGYSVDPLEEKAKNPIPGLIHKYQGRILLVVSSGCAINCRYCFRRHFSYSENNPSKAQWSKALDYISHSTDTQEVIFSGGDPLAANDKYLAWLTEAVANIPHIKRLRIHSRIPIVIPQRIDKFCLQWMSSSRLQTVMVTHCNHVNEIDHHVINSIRHMIEAGISVFNQTVLLKGINDRTEDQIQLNEALFEAGVIPYYLHLLDKVQGAAHFEVEESKAQKLIADMIRQLPGYMVPRLVKETPGASSKTPLMPCL